jgi:hypothetical protein
MGLITEKRPRPSVVWGGSLSARPAKELSKACFFEISTKAGLYRSKLLGLVALHTLGTTDAQVYSLDKVADRIYCDNIYMLNQSNKHRKRVSAGVKHSDLHHRIRMLKCMWLSKQCIGICTTRLNLAQIQDILDDKCPNCGQAWETSTHLNKCPNNSRILLFKKSVTK